MIDFHYKAPALKRILHRNRFDDLFENKKGCKIISICGRSGQGKSYTAADFLKSNNLDYKWYNLTKEDNNLEYLIDHLLSPFNLSQGNISDRDVISIFSREVIKEFEDDFYIVLDDFQLIDPNSRSKELIENLITTPLEKIHFIILSRLYPQLSLSKMRSKKELVEIKDRDLLFTEGEIRDFFHDIYGINIESGYLLKILEASDGWITALVHIAENIESKSGTEQDEFLNYFITEKRLITLDEFFVQEVLQDLDDQEKLLLIKLSIFNSIPEGLVIKLTGKNGINIIKNLISRRLFVKWLDESLRIVSIHPVFSAYLRNLFDNLAEAEREKVYHQAADFYYENANQNDAIQYYIMSSDVESAEKIFLSKADDLTEHHQYKELYNLILLFPENIRNKNPLLLYYYAITTNLVHPLVSRKTLLELLDFFRKSEDINREAKIYSVLLANYIFYQGNQEAVQELVAVAESFLKQFGDSLIVDRKEILSSLVALGRWWTMPELDEAYTIALRAEETSIKIRNEEILIFSHFVLAKIYLDRGEFNEAENILKKTELTLKKHPSYAQYEALLRFYLGDTYFYLGDISKGLIEVEDGMKKTYKGFSFYKYLKLNQVLYLLYLPDIGEAETILDIIREEEIGENLYLKYFSIYLLQMLLAYRQSNKQRTDYYCSRLMDTDNKKLLHSDFPFSYLALAEVLMYLGQYKRALEMLGNLLREAPIEKYPYPNATAFALMGVIYFQQNDGKESQRCFELMGKILKDKDYKNLDICNPNLLYKTAKISRQSIFDNFLRLKKLGTLPVSKESEIKLRIYTLGDFKLDLNGRILSPATVSRQKKVMDLLKLLIVHRKTGMVKEVLYELFWPGYMQKSSRDNLNTIIYRLRRLFGEKDNYIITDSNMIRLNTEICSIDVDMFWCYSEEGIKARKQNDVDSALDYLFRAKELYRGDFLEKDLYYDDIRDAREIIFNRYLHLLFELGKLNLSSGKASEALELSEELINRDTLCEPAYRMLMISSALLGNISQIPRIYDRLKQKLQRYYNIMPDPKTSDLRDMLLKGIMPENSMWEAELLGVSMGFSSSG